uniref:Uncharacterized protein n=1 Tax=Opuntia streptacantha TaxID=393608 RepID=A0A7C9F4A9_OPUST
MRIDKPAYAVHPRSASRLSPTSSIPDLSAVASPPKVEALIRKSFQTPAGKMSARELNKNLSPKSQEKAKQLLLEYAGSERGQGDTDLESNFSQPSSPGSEDFDNASIDSSHLERQNRKWMKSRISQALEQVLLLMIH